MTVQSRMTHRASIRREPERAGPYGQPTGQMVTVVSNAPCFVSQNTDSRLLSVDRTANVETYQLLFPTHVDVRANDEVGPILDRRNQQLYGGKTVKVNTVVYHQNSHLQCIAEAVK